MPRVGQPAKTLVFTKKQRARIKEDWPIYLSIEVEELLGVDEALSLATIAIAESCELQLDDSRPLVFTKNEFKIYCVVNTLKKRVDVMTPDQYQKWHDMALEEISKPKRKRPTKRSKPEKRERPGKGSIKTLPGLLFCLVGLLHHKLADHCPITPDRTKDIIDAPQ